MLKKSFGDRVFSLGLHSTDFSENYPTQILKEHKIDNLLSLRDDPALKDTPFINDINTYLDNSRTLVLHQLLSKETAEMSQRVWIPRKMEIEAKFMDVSQ
jgi:hypothetical protein